MFSATTTELSTRRPTQITRPRMVSRFSDSPAKYITATDIKRQSGIARVIISVIRKRRKKRYNIIAAKNAPILPFENRVLSCDITIPP
tara:strand:+ start:292 stop:555 length:264 start_codon:yes stop_codon:yes gene_type:complete